MSYLVLQTNGYSNDADSYMVCKNRAEVEAQLVDFGYLDNPAIIVYKVEPGTDAAVYARLLVSDPDSYPDWVVSYGPRSGVRWERA